MRKNRIVFRADGNSNIGMGHIMRCLAVASYFDNKYDKLFILNTPSQQIQHVVEQSCSCLNIFENHNFKIEEHLLQNDIVIIDGYHFNTHYQKTIKQKAKALIAIDDLAENHFYCDAILNHGDISVLPSYKKENFTKLFNGINYLILRKPFLIEAVKQPKTVEKISTALICMGSADPYNITLKLLQACSQISFINEVNVIIGSVYNFKNELDLEISKIQHQLKINLYKNLGVQNLIEVVQASQIAFTTASTIALEVCCIKSVLVFGTVVNNQNAIYSLLQKSKCGVGFNSWQKTTISQIVEAVLLLENTTVANSILKNQAEVFDGQSEKRIVKLIESYAA